MPFSGFFSTLQLIIRKSLIGACTISEELKVTKKRGPFEQVNHVLSILLDRDRAVSVLSVELTGFPDTNFKKYIFQDELFPCRKQVAS
jgi:hypothetical protein